MHASSAAGRSPAIASVSLALSIALSLALIVAPGRADAQATRTPSASASPEISLILSGLYTRTRLDPASYRYAGIPLPADAEIGPGTRSFSLGESELGFAAAIDPWWRGQAHIALHPDDSVSVEEAFVQTTALGRGWNLKAGRLFSGIGYLNSQHAHAWDFVDNPIAYQALLGTQFGIDGLQVRWLAPTELLIELAAEAGRPGGYPGGSFAGNGAGASALSLHVGGDAGASHSWRAGVSWLAARASEQSLQTVAANGDEIESVFGGRTRVWILDAVWKWAPGGNATQTNFKLQGEWLRSTRTGDLVVDPAGLASSAAYRAVQSGWYLQAIYQFTRGWRVGARTERLDPGRPDTGANAALLADAGPRPRKDSLMLDYAASEFSRVRLQYSRDRARPGAADGQFFVQYQMSLGAHGAHGF